MRTSRQFLLRLLLVLSLGLVFAGSPLFSQQVPEPQQLSPSQTLLLNNIESKLQTALQQLQECQQLLKDRSLTLVSYKAKLDELQATISDLTLQINNLKAIRDSLQANLDSSAITITSLNKKINDLGTQLTTLQQQFSALSMTFELYKESNDKVVKNLTLERDGWKIVAIVASALVIGTGTYIGLHAAGVVK